MPDNIYPDLSNDKFDIKYHQLRILGSDVRRASAVGRYGTGTSTPPNTDGGGASNSGEGSGCLKFVNAGNTPAVGVTYVDCDGNVVPGVTIIPGEAFCALSVESFGTCGNITIGGSCENCAPCCIPTVTSVNVFIE